MVHRKKLPVLPLRETVVFPGVAVPISAGRPGTIEAIQAALSEDRRMFAVCQRENVDDPSPEVLYALGVVVKVVQTQRVRGGLQLLVQAETRARARTYEPSGEAMLEAAIVPAEELEPIDPEDAGLLALDAELRERAVDLGRRRGIPAEALNQLVQGVDDPGAFADIVAFYLEIPAEEKQALLEVVTHEERMRKVLVAVERDLLRMDAQEEIQQRVQEELGDKQREMVLREQLKAIKRELNEDEETDELEDLRERIEELELPEAAREEVERELSRLERTHPQSAEHQVIRTYLDWVLDLPWNERTPDEIDLEAADGVLEADHYGLEDVKDRVLEFLSVRKLQMERAAEERVEAEAAESEPAEESEAGSGPDDGDDAGVEGERAKARAVGRGPILLFVGPPGVGKTSIARSVARALGREYVRIALGGARDEADIRGHRRTYVGAMPGRIIQGMKQAGTKNPVFLLDEVDKLGVSLQGDPSSALLEVLDPAQNHSFVDHYLGVPFDLSEVLFIATANYMDRIPAPLHDRMEMVEFSGYTEREKLEIAKRYLAPRQREANGLTDEEIEITDDAIGRVINAYTREAGVRNLERELGKLARKAARTIAKGEAERVTIDADQVQALLGKARVHPERAAAEDAVGVATGMYYTPMGGDIMFVEASVSSGKDDLILTGQLGDVMKESARAALTYAKTNHEALGIPEENRKDLEIHIHVPAGAVPKDGPSAGVTMATALVSALSRRAVRHDVAMTGEVTLTGRVLPIGGVKEKVLGAHRAGIGEVILPKANESHLEDLPDDVRERLTFHLVDDLGQALAVAMRGASLRKGTLTFPDPEIGGQPAPAGKFPGQGQVLNRSAEGA